MRTLLLLLALLLAGQISLVAQVQPVPPSMNFQGRLAKPDGTPVPDGNYSLRFSLWTAASGGVEKWNQTIAPVTVRNGVCTAKFNISTGSSDKFKLPSRRVSTVRVTFSPLGMPTRREGSCLH